MLGTFGTTSVLNYGFALLMGWLLSPGDFGWLAFSQALLLVAGIVLQSGLVWSLTRAVANTTGDEQDSYVRGTMAANLILATLMGLAVAALFEAGPLRSGLESWVAAVLVVLAFPLMSIAATARGCAQGHERFGMVASLGLTEMTCKFVAGAGLVLAGLGVPGAIGGFVVGALASAGIGVYHLRRGIGTSFWGRLRLPDRRNFLPMFATLLCLPLMLSIDLVALKLLGDNRELAGYYQAALILSNAPYYLVMSAFAPVLFVQLARTEGVPHTHSGVAETLGLTAALVLPLEAICAVIPRTSILTFFPDSYAAGASALRLLAFGNTALIVAAILATAFQAAGRAKFPALTLAAILAVESVALWITVPRWEIAAAATVFTAAAGCALLVLGFRYASEIGLPFLLRASPWLLRYVFCGGAGLVAGLAVSGAGAGDLVSAILGGMFYAAGILWLGVVHVPAWLRNSVMFRKLATAIGKG
jgi:O-antigen/teichoic acid export membrane protein